MKSLEILALGVRLVGIYFLLNILSFWAGSYGPIIYQWMYVGVDESIAQLNLQLLLFYSIVGLFSLLACFVLIRFPLTVSGWLLPRSKADEPVFNGSIEDLKIAAFIIMGVYILSWAVPGFFYNTAMLIKLQNPQFMALYHRDEGVEYIIRALVSVLEIAVGLYLCLQARGLNALINRLRWAGLSRK